MPHIRDYSVSIFVSNKVYQHNVKAPAEHCRGFNFVVLDAQHWSVRCPNTIVFDAEQWSVRCPNTVVFDAEQCSVRGRTVEC